MLLHWLYVHLINDAHKLNINVLIIYYNGIKDG